MVLSELIAKLGTRIVDCRNLTDVEVLDVTDASGECREGSVFCAVAGAEYNGADFIPEALRRGACCAVVSEGDLRNKNWSVIISKNPRKTMAEIAKILYGNPNEDMTVIGVTGTKGKSTTCEYLRALLEFSGKRCVSVGTLGVRGLLENIPQHKNTTPPSHYLYKVLSRARDEGCTVAIIEVSSQALCDFRVHGIKFDYAVYTGFSYDHIGKGEHKNIKEYFFAKRRLFTDYGSPCAIVFDDGELSYKISYGAKRIVRVGTNPYDEFYLEDMLELSDGMSFSLFGRRLRIALNGHFNVTNAALALACATEITGREPDFFREALSAVRVRGRFELYTLGGVNLIIDYAHNQDSLRAIISAVRRSSFGRIIAVFGSVGERARARRRELAVTAEELCDLSVVTADNPGREDAADICREIARYFEDKGKVRIITDREEAIRYAISVASAGDYVLLLGKGHENFQLLGSRRVPFSERDIILSLGATASS